MKFRFNYYFVTIKIKLINVERQNSLYFGNQILRAQTILQKICPIVS